MASLNFDREIESYIEAARRAFLRERGGIIASQAHKGALHSGSTGLLIARAANASALGVAQSLSTEALASARVGSKRLAVRQRNIRLALARYRHDLRALADFEMISPDHRAGLARFHQEISDGEEDVRRLLQRHEDGRSAGPPQPWPNRRPVLVFWIATILSVLGLLVGVAAFF